MNEKAGISILRTIYKCRTIAPIELIGDGMIGYKFCLIPGRKNTPADAEMVAAWNGLIESLVEKNLVELSELNEFFAENVHMSYHDYTAAGGHW